MKSSDRQKMCSNCNGRVSLDALECPYCAAEFTEPTAQFKNQNLQDSLASLYKPPYSAKTEKETPVRKQAVFKEPEAVVAALPAEEGSAEHAKGDFWSLFALIVGSNLLTIGLLQLFFSDNGFLRLEWDSSFWYLYCLIALPLFYYGFKKAGRN